MAPPYNKYRDRKDLKTREIKKSLVHKARLKKNYFKMLEKEGEVVPEKRATTTTTTTEHQQQDQKSRMTYEDRTKLNKERRVELKKQSLERQRAKLRLIAEANNRREVRKEKFNKKTKNGQPLMGPRISDLLSKIKEGEN